MTRGMCPVCHYVLPPNWRGSHTTCIALAGARATGKTVYLAVAVKQLEQLVQRLGSTLVPADQSTKTRFYTFYERPLYELRGVMLPTPTAKTADSYHRDPLIFSLGLLSGQRRYLVMRDVAGEDLEAENVEVRHLAFFAHADAVLFMFDPLRVQEIRDQLQDLLPTQLHRGGDPAMVLGNLMRIIGQSTPRVAMILSKFDAMQALSAVEGTDWNRVMSNSGAAFMRDPGLGATSYDNNDGELLHEEVRSLLERLHAQTMVTTVERPHSGKRLVHRFFAVSTLGEAVDGERLHARGIAPFRCLDPLLWVLSQQGVL